MPMIIGPDDEIHLTTFEDASTALCGMAMCGADMINPVVAVPATCNPCRIENGKRIRARMNANKETPCT